VQEERVASHETVLYAPATPRRIDLGLARSRNGDPNALFGSAAASFLNNEVLLSSNSFTFLLQLLSLKKKHFLSFEIIFSFSSYVCFMSSSCPPL